MCGLQNSKFKEIISLTLKKKSRVFKSNSINELFKQAKMA